MTYKQKRKGKILKILAIVFLVLQLFIYLSRFAAGPPNNSDSMVDPAEIAGYYFGLNIFLVISLILFFISWRMQKKNIREQQEELIDSIGKP